MMWIWTSVFPVIMPYAKHAQTPEGNSKNSWKLKLSTWMVYSLVVRGRGLEYGGREIESRSLHLKPETKLREERGLSGCRKISRPYLWPKHCWALNPQKQTTNNKVISTELLSRINTYYDLLFCRYLEPNETPSSNVQRPNYDPLGGRYNFKLM